MKTIDLSKGQHSLSEVLALAKSEAVLIHSVSGEDFVLEHADDFVGGAESGEHRRVREKLLLGSADANMDFEETWCACGPQLERLRENQEGLFRVSSGGDERHSRSDSSLCHVD